MFDGHFRTTAERAVRPVGEAIGRTGVSADHLTAAGLGMAGATAVAIGSGRLGLGAALLVAAALPDLLDGAVAKAAGTSSPRGAFFDSVSDRVTDALVLGGIGWHLAGSSGRGAMLPFAVLGTSSLISYQRAKAESLGYDAKGGLMERAERIIVLVAGLAISSLLVPVLWLMLALTSLTAIQRFAKVWRQASAPRPVQRPSAVPLSSRWRTWRAANSVRASTRWQARRGARPTAATRAWRERTRSGTVRSGGTRPRSR